MWSRCRPVARADDLHARTGGQPRGKGTQQNAQVSSGERDAGRQADLHAE